LVLRRTTAGFFSAGLETGAQAGFETPLRNPDTSEIY
jgi:hypothetical protein